MKGSLLKFGLFVPLFALFCTVLLGGSSASAASSFDGYIKTTDKLQLKYGECDPLDISTSYGAYINDTGELTVTNQISQNAKNAYNQALTNGGDWTVVNSSFSATQYTPARTTVHIYFAPTDMKLVWQEDLTVNITTVNLTHYYYINLNMNSSCKVTAHGDSWGETVIGMKPNEPSLKTAYGDVSVFLQNVAQPNYPTGYEGVIPPDTYTPPTPPSDHTPDWYVSKAHKWLVNIHDTNFNTFDDNPFLCNEDGLAPVIDYTISKNSDGTILETGTQSATVQFDWQAPKEEDLIKYDIKGKYYCGDEPGDMQFTEFGTYHFSVNKHGQLAITAVDDCITELAPYVNLEGCMNNIFGFIDLLSFGTITFGGNDWTADTQCRQLGTFSTWLNLSYEQSFLCPQIPADIRNTVTPFITFLLGLLTVTFLSKRHMSDLG